MEGKPRLPMHGNEKIRLSVVLIAHNEEANIETMIRGLLGGYSSEIRQMIIVDDASSDKTQDVVRSLISEDSRILLIAKGSPCGAGRALTIGVRSVDPQATHILMMDSDFLPNIQEVRNLLHCVCEGYDGAIGSRFIGGWRLSHYPFLKLVFNRAFHLCTKWLIGLPCRDLTNNFKLYRREMLRTIPWVSPGFAINAETGIFPILAGYRMKEVPVSWKQRSAGVSKFNLFRDGPGYARILILALRKKRQWGSLKKENGVVKVAE